MDVTNVNTGEKTKYIELKYLHNDFSKRVKGFWNQVLGLAQYDVAVVIFRRYIFDMKLAISLDKCIILFIFCYRRKKGNELDMIKL